MRGNISSRPKPEEAELLQKRQELERLKGQLVEHELQLENLKAELASFEKLYVEVVGIKYAELDEIEAQIAELKARREPHDSVAQRVADDARKQAQESKASTGTSASSVRGRFSPSPSLKSLYREVARKIHPDLATDDIDRDKRQKLMAEANRAYEEGDESRLKAILEEYETSPESVQGEGTASELIRMIRKIAQVKRRLVEIEEETESLRKSELFELRAKVDEGRKQGRNLLEEMASAVSQRVIEAQATLRRMTEERDA